MSKKLCGAPVGNDFMLDLGGGQRIFKRCHIARRNACVRTSEDAKNRGA